MNLVEKLHILRSWKCILPQFVDAAPDMLEKQFHEQGHCIASDTYNKQANSGCVEALNNVSTAVP